MKKYGFTLAEVLITLGIIGVVAAMTLPTLIQKQQEKIAVNQLKKAYSVFSQAFLRAVAENGPAESWDIGTQDSIEGAKKLYNMFKPYLLKVEDCGVSQGCFYSSTYKALNAPSYAWQPSSHSKYARGILADGTSFLFWTAGSGCNVDDSVDGTGKFSKICGAIKVDINGSKSPNQAGVDYFNFAITPNGIIPSGGKEYQSSSGEICEYNNSSNINGLVCTAWVILKGNMEYLRRDISNEW